MFDLLKLLAILALIILLLRRGWNLGLVLLLASAGLGLLFARPALDLIRDGLGAATDLLTLRLVAVVLLIMTLGEMLRQTAGLRGMVQALVDLFPDNRLVLAAIPALVGLLPMVGGAMFSAPMVDEIGTSLGVSRERKTFVNYWFRHMWEYVLPVYPSILLATALLELSVRQLVAVQWPLFVAAIVGGVLFGMLGLRRGGNPTERQDRWYSLKRLFASTWPIVLVILLALILGLDLILSLVLTLALLMAVKRVGLRTLWEIEWYRVPWHTVVVIFGAMIFRRVLGTTGAVEALSQALTDLHIPAVVVVCAVPAVAGLLTGLGTGAYSVGLPVVLPFIGRSPADPTWAAWAYAGGMLGVMLSPLHLCLALTRIYFKAEWGRVYRMIVPAALLVVATAVGLLLLHG